MARLTLSIDLQTRRITAGVTELTGEGARRVIGLGGSGLSRLWLGQELHRRIQTALGEEEPGFSPEVHLSTEIQIDDWTLALTGRADGVLFDGECPLRIDEIKTLHFAVDLNHLFTDERLEPFRHQVRLYAWMLSKGGPPIPARLILADIVTGEEREETVPWAPDLIEAWLRKRVYRLVAAEERRLRRLEELRDAAEKIPFPHAEPRALQLEIGEMVRTTIEAGEHLLLQASTGTGKTAAVLHPALQAALTRGKRVFFLTAKTLQQRLASQTLRAMQGERLFRSLQLRAKAKMCANTEMVCHEEFCPWAKEYGVKLVRTGLLRELLEGSSHQDPDRIYERASNTEVCPFEVSLDLLPDVDVVVCDYNYVFDPTIGLAALLGGSALQDAVLVIDEVHNLVDRSRDYYSPVLRRTDILRATEFLTQRDNRVFNLLAELCQELADLVGDLVDQVITGKGDGDQITTFDPEDFSNFRMAFDGAMLQYFLYKRENDLWIAEDPVMDIFLSLTRFHRVLGLGGSEFVHLARRSREEGDVIKIFCRDASRFIGAVLEETAGVVAMSATLEPFGFYRDLLGFDAQRTSEMALPSPFPESNRLVVNIADIDTTWRRRAAHYDAVASWITRLAPGQRNSLVLFPSYAYLRAVHERMPPTEHSVLAQNPGSTEGSQHEVLEALAGNDPHVVLAVLGGIFAEGVDYPGDMLSQVIVVSPGLPQFNTERELLKQHFQEAYGHGFSYAYLIPGITRVVQAAGRLIRSESDRGVIVLIGRRFQDGRHARFLPAPWTDGDPRNLLYEDPEFSIQRFFDE
ncbi:MAG: hypothetical protein K8R59_18615 [Thermoanaerobaculales bacterium]|nr:hypothetical protein [Thermoanaerobaculales bacterium]